MQPGEKFHGQYDVVPLSAFQTGKCPTRVPVFTIKEKEIFIHKTTKFPLAEARDAKAYKVDALDYDKPPEAIMDEEHDSEEFWNNLESLPEESEADGVLYDPPQCRSP